MKVVSYELLDITTGNIFIFKQDGPWKWARTGELLEYTNWYPGEPDNALGIQFCASMDTKGHRFEWNDLQCTADKTLKPICQKFA